MVDEGLEDYLEARWLENIAKKVLVAQGADSGAELGLVIVGQERIRQLNLSYLGEDKPTDVLAFSMLPQQPGESKGSFVNPPDGMQHLGEVIISYPQAVAQAEERRHPVKREIAILTIHGILHLLGYDHDKPEPELQMKAREAKILSQVEGELG